MPERVRWTRLLSEAVGERAAQPRRICELCTRLLQITGAGIAMLSDAGQGARSSAPPTRARRGIEELQFTLGEGPCVDAVRTGAPVLVPNLGEPNDLNVDRRPGFMEGAGAAGVRAVFAFPLRVGAINVGALDRYRNRPGALTAAQLSGDLNQHTVTRSAGRHRLVTADVPSLHHSLRRAAQRSMARARLARVTSAPAQHLGP